VIFETLEKMSLEIDVANLIWLCSRNIQKHYKLKGKEKELIIQFITKLGNKIETNAAENWSISSGSKIPGLKIEIAKLTDVSIDITELENHLKAASIHSGLGNSGENPQYPSHNALIWPNFFSQRAARGITETINKALNQQSVKISEIQNKLQEIINKALTHVLTENQQNNNSLQMRNELLWWKESCYSKTLKHSYRDSQNGMLQIILALDYNAFMPFICPQSVDYFLKETHKGIIKEDDKKIKFLEILKLIDSSKETLKQYLTEDTFEDERISLSDFINGYIFGKYSINQIKNNVGISENTELTLSEFTLWLFHDLQVVKFFKK
jgi:hypothetical protein